MTEPRGPYDAYGNPQDRVPGRPDPGGFPEEPRYEEQRGGFSTFPFPHYSTRTRGGTQISVGGCCLPLPIGCLTVLATASGVALSRALRRSA